MDVKDFVGADWALAWSSLIRGDTVPTLKDLSAHLGLSVTQVSRALNNHADVSEKTRERVKKAATQLNYRPNLSARKLVSGRSGMVGFVLPEPPAAPIDGLIIQMLGYLSTAFAKSGLQFILHIAPEKEDLLDVYASLIDDGGLDGFFIGEPVQNDPRVTFLKKRNVPFVMHGRDFSDRSYPFFDIDNEKVGYVLAQHLLSKGHRKIGFLNGVQNLTYAENRARGYQRALQEAGVAHDPMLVRNGTMIVDYGFEAATEMLNDAKNAPTAIIAGNTWIAKGIYDAARALNLRIPHDLSVVAHDDNLYGAATAEMDPPLTVTAAPLNEHWQTVAELLVGAISGSDVNTLQKIIDIEFVDRASVADHNP